MPAYTFQQLLNDLINELGEGSQRKFAILADVANSTISRLLKDRDRKPDLDTLVRISQVSGRDLISLIRLAYPEAVEINRSPTADIVADEFDKLPDELKSAIVAIMRGVKARG